MVALLVVAAVQLAPVRVATPPHLDGRLDDAAWSQAAPFTGFVQKNPDAGAPASEPTSVRVVYDDTALWIGIDCVQTRSPVVARLTRRDRAVDSDWIEVDLDSRGTRRDAFEFQVNAAGVLVDALRYDDTEVNADWDENWEAQVARTPTGWSAEIRIPFPVLRYTPATGERWGVQVRRFISARQETDELAPIPRGEAGETSRYGVLGPFDALPNASSIELRPFAVTSIQRDIDHTVTPRATVGGDLKWHVTPTLTLDATVNPDFAQVEADQRVLNLTTTETYYPEKRAFFLEGADLFAAPIQLLYTRRIGRVPDVPVLPDGETARGAPAPDPLWGAAKLTGTVAGTQIGGLAAVTGENTISTVDASGDHERTLDPASAFAALRARHAVGANAYLGAFATAVGRFEHGGYAVAGDTVVCPDGTVVAIGERCMHDAVVGGVDGRWRSSSGAYVIDGDVGASAIHGGPPREQLDGIVIASGDVSPQGRLHAAKQDNGPVFDVTAEAAGRRFEINDVGYLPRANFIHLDLNAGWKDTEPGDVLRDSVTQIEYYDWQNWRGDRIAGGYQLNTQVTFNNYWTMFTELHWRPTYFDDREVGDGTALERAGRLGWELAGATDPRRSVQVSLSQAAHVLASATDLSDDGDVLIHALPQFDIEVLPSLLVSRGEPRYVLALADGDRQFGRQYALAAGVTLRTTYTFTPRATLQLYAQLFGESVAYRDFTTAPSTTREVRIDELTPSAAPDAQISTSSTIINASAVFRWEWRLGSLLYVVYTRSQGESRAFDATSVAPIPWRAGLGAPSGQVFLVKLSYWWS